MDNAQLGLIAGLSVAAFSAATSLLVRGIGARIPSITLNAWRCTVAALIFLPLWWVATGGHVPDTRSLMWIGLSVLFSIVIGDTSFFIAIKKIGVSKAMPIAKTFPAITVLLSWILLDETLGPLKLLGVAFAVAGTALMSQPPADPALAVADNKAEARSSRRDHWIGFLVAVGTAFAWAIGAVVLKVSLTSASVTEVSLFKTIVAGSMLWIMSSRVDRVPVGAVLFNRTSLLLAVATGFTLAGAALLLVYSISLVGAGTASVYAGLAPLFAVPLGVLIFKERMSIPAAIGCVLAIGGIICVSMG
jgi:drug/metabolite transporter (DMT)-like permease